jgi:PAS domain S-box-containing protein
MADHRELFELFVRRVEDYAVYLLDAGGHVLTWNPGAERIKGYSEAEILGKHLSVFYPPEDKHVAEIALRTAAETGHFEAEAWRMRKDGTRFWGMISLTALRDEAGELKGFAKITRDLTGRMQTEERLRATQLKYDLLMAGVKEYAVFLMDAGGRVIDWSTAAERLLGYTEAEIVGRPLETFFPPDQHGPDGIPARVLRDAAEKGRTEEESWHVRKDGSPFWGSGITSALRDGSGGLRGFAKVLLDRTERKQAEDTLRDETRVLGLLNRTGSMIAARLDLDGLLQSVTDAATELTGAQFGAFFYNGKDERGEAYLLYTLSGAPREKFENFGHPRPTPLFGPTFRGEDPIRLADVTKDPRYGQWGPSHGMPPGHLPVRSYLAVPVVSRSGEVIGGLFFGHEEPGVFTERAEQLVTGVAAQAAVAIDNARLYEDVRRAAEERRHLLEAERAARSDAERASLMKDEFLSTLSHELRTPLSAILGWSQLLKMGDYTPGDLAEGLETIERNARAQTRLIDDLLDMNRIISGKIRLDVQPTELAQVVDSAVESVRPSADAKGIRLRKVLDPLAGPVSGDPTRLQQVVWNLLTNAIKFTPKGGRVDVLVERVNSHIEVTVSDSGEGIAPEFLPHVFERFRQADSSISRRHGGLGLGLSIVRQLVELHGGTVRAKSAGEGQGSTFMVSLPLAPVRENGSREHPLGPKSPLLAIRDVDLAGVKVLVVDDEPDARELVKRVLVQCKAEVTTAGGADEALSLLKSARPDVIVSDIGMPGKDGYTFLREVRALPAAEGGRTPAIALTAFARSEDRTRAMLAGYQVHVAKPIEPQELVATVASLAGRMGAPP